MSVVLLNDTRPDHHHGCSRVMRVLEEGLARHGLTMTARSPLRHDWTRDGAILAALRGARLVVINGEGTLHHGSRHGETLISVAGHPAARGVPVALVNALWQDNPPAWAAWLDRMALVAVRDGRSAAAVSALTRTPVRMVPDLTLAERIPPVRPRRGVLWGDSVDRATADLLARLAKSRGEPWVPSLSALKPARGRSLLLRWWHARRGAAQARAFARSHPGFALDPDEAAHAARIARAELLVTGRFHGACYALAAGTPFLALDSNSWKIAALIEDAGLAPWRRVATEDLPGLLDRGPEALAWSEPERAALGGFLDRARDGAEALFADLARLAR